MEKIPVKLMDFTIKKGGRLEPAVIFDEFLRTIQLLEIWNPHVANKVSKCTGIIRKSSFYLSTKTVTNTIFFSSLSIPFLL